jgi:hypothetical protein
LGSRNCRQLAVGEAVLEELEAMDEHQPNFGPIQPQLEMVEAAF